MKPRLVNDRLVYGCEEEMLRFRSYGLSWEPVTLAEQRALRTIFLVRDALAMAARGRGRER